MNKFALAALTAALLATSSITPSHAGNFFESAVEDIGDAAEGLNEHVLEPTIEFAGDKILDPALEAAKQTVIKTVDIGEDAFKGMVAISGAKLLEDVLIEGKSLDQSMNETLDDAKNMVRAVAKAPMLVNYTLNGVTKIVTNVGGDIAGDVVGVVTLPAAIVSSLPAAITDTLIATSEKPADIKQARGIPLNAALKQAYQAYEGTAKPIPATIAALLKSTFGADHLATVRYVVDDGTSNIGGLINALRSQFGEAVGDNSAVTVGNIIIFAHEPSPKVDDLYFWAHEIQHTVQYKALDFDGFAAKYTAHHGDMEDEADQIASSAVEEVRIYLAAF